MVPVAGQVPGPWGIAASPIFAGDRVIQNCDAQGASSIVAPLDKKTGKIVWRTFAGRETHGRLGHAH